MSNPADLATRQIVEARRRWSMWLLRGTDRCEAYECDFCEDVTIAKRLKVADVVVGSAARRYMGINEKLINLAPSSSTTTRSLLHSTKGSL